MHVCQTKIYFFFQVLALQQAVMTLKEQVAASKLSLPNVTDISEISGELEALREALRQKDISLQQMSQALIVNQAGQWFTNIHRRNIFL